MKMAEIQAGLGFGVKKFQARLGVRDRQGAQHFVNSGWEFGAQATAAAKTGDKGASLPGRGGRGTGRLAVPADR